MRGRPSSGVRVGSLERARFFERHHPEHWNPKERGPLCLNAPTVRSVLPLEFKLTELARQDSRKMKILTRMRVSIANKEFGPPVLEPP